jgi:hypothetical protein
MDYSARAAGAAVGDEGDDDHRGVDRPFAIGRIARAPKKRQENSMRWITF